MLDYFGDRIDEAAAALYHLGLAHLENGDVREGMKAMREMADDEDYQKHPLAAGAIRRLADNHWQNKDTEHGRQVLEAGGARTSGQTNDEETGIAGAAS